jgi:hypothetical protein
MWYTLVAVAVGLVAGLLAGGRFGNLATRDFRGWALLPVGVVVQLVPDLVGAAEDAAFVFLAASYACLALFALLNLHVVGMAVVTVGLVLNLAPVLANEGMPVRAEAAVAARIIDWDEIGRIEFDPKHHLETPDDRFMVLADIIPVRPLREVLSFGDLVMAVGIADVLFRLLKPAGARRRRARPRPDRHLAAPGANGPDTGGGHDTTAGSPVAVPAPRDPDEVVVDLTAPRARLDGPRPDLPVRRSG